MIFSLRLLDEKKVSVEFVTELMQSYKDQKKLHRKYAFQVSFIGLEFNSAQT